MKPSLELLILGVAGGAGYVYERQCSCSFLILENSQPLALVDLGYGVTWELQQQGFAFPKDIIITHNHSDHAGELPVVLMVERERGNRLVIHSASEVRERLRTYRLKEHAALFHPDELADWAPVDKVERTQLASRYEVKFLPGKHSTACFGFILSTTEGVPLVGYTSDSGMAPDLYSSVAQAMVSIFEGRPSGNPWHASFSEIEPFLGANSFITGHGLKPETTQAAEHRRFPLLFPGRRIPIVWEHP